MCYHCKLSPSYYVLTLQVILQLLYGITAGNLSFIFYYQCNLSLYYYVLPLQVICQLFGAITASYLSVIWCYHCKLSLSYYVLSLQVISQLLCAITAREYDKLFGVFGHHTQGQTHFIRGGGRCLYFQ